jgi:hypothetical protein
MATLTGVPFYSAQLCAGDHRVEFPLPGGLRIAIVRVHKRLTALSRDNNCSNTPGDSKNTKRPPFHRSFSPSIFYTE